MREPKIAAKTAKKPKPPAKHPIRRTEKQKAAARDGMRRIYQAMEPAERSLQRWRKQAKPPVPRKGSVRADCARNVAIAQAYCDWSDIDEVVRMYVAAAVMTELTGEVFVVDHRVPLSHALVSGLHTHTNLQVIPQWENRLKGNWLWPDMWPVDWSTMAFLQEQKQDRLEAANDDEITRSAAAVGRSGA